MVIVQAYRAEYRVTVLPTFKDKTKIICCCILQLFLKVFVILFMRGMFENSPAGIFEILQEYSVLTYLFFYSSSIKRTYILYRNIDLYIFFNKLRRWDDTMVFTLLWFIAKVIFDTFSKYQDANQFDLYYLIVDKVFDPLLKMYICSH